VRDAAGRQITEGKQDVGKLQMRSHMVGIQREDALLTLRRFGEATLLA
jgi:hypothetical protein